MKRVFNPTDMARILSTKEGDIQVPGRGIVEVLDTVKVTDPFVELDVKPDDSKKK